MTDKEIIKSLECCCENNVCPDVCPLKDMAYVGDCYQVRSKYTLDLINRQQAEIERLKAGMKKLVEKKRLYIENMQATREFQIEQAKSEARKEFAERLKEEAVKTYYGELVFTEDDFDNLLKEMG